MKCPKCGSENVQFATNTKGRTGYSLIDSCCGLILLGPLGLLCGISSDVSTDEFWICHNCGNKFSTNAGKRKMETDKKNAENYAKYKEELSQISAVEGNYQSIYIHYQQAINQSNIAKQQYDKLLSDLAASDNKQIRRAAKFQREKVLAGILAGMIILGFILLFTEVVLGLCLLIPGIIFAIIYTVCESKNKEKLYKLYPAFKYVEDKKKSAEATEGYYKSLTEKIAYVNEYEANHREI